MSFFLLAKVNFPKTRCCSFIIHSIFIIVTLPTVIQLTLSWRRPLSYRNQSIDLFSKSMDWFLFDNGPRHERVKWNFRKAYRSNRSQMFFKIGILKNFAIFTEKKHLCTTVLKIIGVSF